MWGLLIAGVALGAPNLDARLDEVAPLRALRLVQDVPAIPADAYADVQAGKTPSGVEQVEGYAAKKAWGVAVVDVPIARYWAAINDDPGKEANGLLGHVKVLEGLPCATSRTVFQYLPVSLASDRWWVAQISVNEEMHRRTDGRVREMKWSSVDYDFSADPEVSQWAAGGMSLEFTQGSWLLVDLDGAHTLVEYYAWTDAGGRIPAGLASRFAAGNIPDTLLELGEVAKRGAGCPVR